ncbi:MAG TPA: DUF4157 domain-containing protein [Acidimicrobiales bacterium]|nr:DUF4157 domain-containing protein [Acidimicrobiales bacterium]
MRRDYAHLERLEAARSPRRANHAPGRSLDAPRPTSIQDLQRKAGNQAVVGLLKAAQPKLDVSPAGDRCEQEADNVANRVVASLSAGPVAVSPGRGEEAKTVSEVKVLGRWAEVGAAGGTLEAGTETAIKAARRGGSPLDGATQARMESAFGADFSQVRLHSGPEATDLNERVQAKAFTIGTDIFFHGAPPDTMTGDGQRLLAHELTHTIQQGGAPAVARRSGQSHEHDLGTTGAAGGARHLHFGPPAVQRHSSWEHSLLGDAKPTVLAKIGTWQDLIDATSKEGKGLTRGKVNLPGIGEVTKGEVMHVLTQEVSRIAL